MAIWKRLQPIHHHDLAINSDAFTSTPGTPSGMHVTTPMDFDYACGSSAEWSDHDCSIIPMQNVNAKVNAIKRPLTQMSWNAYYENTSPTVQKNIGILGCNIKCHVMCN